jgi:hypothetical protein
MTLGQVNSICLELLNVELVNFFRESFGEESGTKLEHIGYDVGYRLMER